MIDRAAFAAFLSERSADPAAFARDAELYRLISKHRLRPIKSAIAPQEAAVLAKSLDAMFSFVVTKSDARQHETEQHAPLFRAIRKSGSGGRA